MLVVSDIDDVFLPKPTDLLINITEARAALESLLGRLNDMFADNHTIGSALGPALQAGFKVMVCYNVIVTHHFLTSRFHEVSHWWQDHRAVVEPSQSWRGRAQKS
jgi:hypothetical protein